MMKKFKVVVPSFNSVDYLPKTLRSIEMQDFKNYEVSVIDDASTHKEQRSIVHDFCTRNNWRAIYHEKNLGALKGIVNAINSFNCEDDDVIFILDGDDWLSHEKVFSHIHEAYTKHDIALTWGQCEIYPAGKSPMRYAQPIPDMVTEQQLYRSIPWVFWHPLTFKYALWRHVKDADLRDVNGDYYMIMYDKAILYPMLEMAGNKKMYLDETLYIYNIQNPLNDYDTTPRAEHDRVNNLIKSKPAYAVLPQFQ